MKYRLLTILFLSLFLLEVRFLLPPEYALAPTEFNYEFHETKLTSNSNNKLLTDKNVLIFTAAIHQALYLFLNISVQKFKLYFKNKLNILAEHMNKLFLQIKVFNPFYLSTIKIYFLSLSLPSIH
ncbi:hypothetical protein [Pseudoalteromonas denitrificans]|uniref:Uncharacterized protein n=1 Tax=Pseudoalteromonas denitrificans DSM 6059 TaxID=1123010 RepID=A0A1I1NG12_9GAMM|nr:hypothetical protein [Pseudoalteromonas denitrificans]SFC96611.1 hypothetical protein SAMN02745724_03071 [Pseudoalteromonas denitrificans DSM 6059]